MDYTFCKYLAGYLDGDGSITLMCRKVEDRYYINADVRLTGAQEARGLFEEIRALYGGNIYQDPKRPNVIQWYTNEAGSIRILEQTKNHMMLKAGISEFVVNFYRERVTKCFSKSEKKKIMQMLKIFRNSSDYEKNYPSLPWLAGYIDSDGCLTSQDGSNKLQFNTHIRCVPALALIQKQFGGSLSIRNTSGNPNAAYCLYLNDPCKCKKLLIDLVDHLKLKRYKAEKFLTACND